MREAVEPRGRVGVLAQLAADHELGEDQLLSRLRVGGQFGVGLEEVFGAPVLAHAAGVPVRAGGGQLRGAAGRDGRVSA